MSIYENRTPYNDAEDNILMSLLHIRHSIKLSVKALEEAGYVRSLSSVEARRKHLRNPSRRADYWQTRQLKRKSV